MRKNKANLPDYVSQHGQLINSKQYSDFSVFGDDIFLCLVVKEREEEAPPACHLPSSTSSCTSSTSEAAARTLPAVIDAIAVQTHPDRGAATPRPPSLSGLPRISLPKGSVCCCWQRGNTQLILFFNYINLALVYARLQACVFTQGLEMATAVKLLLTLFLIV